MAVRSKVSMVSGGTAVVTNASVGKACMGVTTSTTVPCAVGHIIASCDSTTLSTTCSKDLPT